MSEPLRVTFVAGPLAVTGANVAALDLGRALAARGHEVSLIAGDGPLADRFRAVGVTVEVAGITGSFLTDLTRSRRLKRLLVARPPDVLHLADHRLARHGSLLARLAGPPWVIGWDGPGAFPRARHGLGAVLVSGRASRDELLAGRSAPGEVVRVVPPGVDLDRYPSPPDPFAEETPVVGTLARLDGGAGLEDLARAVAILLGDGVSLHLLVMGQGPDEMRLRRLARQLSIQGHVTLTSPPRGFESGILAVDVFVAPATRAWSGTDVLQAMAAARPVVASGVGVNFTVVQEAETGLLVPRGSPVALAERIRGLLRDPAAAVEMGRRGRARVTREFGIDNSAARMEEVYREVVEEDGNERNR